jgi:hypothetical protein
MMARMIILIMYADQVPVAALTAGILAQLAIGLLLLIVTFVSLVLFFMWFRRAYYNLRLIKGKTRYAAGWAVGAWFVPVVQLFMPYQIMHELFRDTKRALLETYPNCGKQLPKNLVGLWWTISMCAVLIGLVPNLSQLIAIPPNVVIICSYALMALNVIIYSFTIKLIYDYAKMEKLLIQ